MTKLQVVAPVAVERAVDAFSEVEVASVTLSEKVAVIAGAKPDALPGGWKDCTSFLTAFARYAKDYVAFLVKRGYTRLACSGNPGTETVFAEAALAAGMPVSIIVPSDSFEAVWTPATQKAFHSLCERSQKVIGPTLYKKYGVKQASYIGSEKAVSMHLINTNAVKALMAKGDGVVILIGEDKGTVAQLRQCEAIKPQTVTVTWNDKFQFTATPVKFA